MMNAKNARLYLIIALIAGAMFVLLYGVYILDPTYTDWLMAGGDLSQHYLGWRAYRDGTWKFPFIGLTDRFAYPNSTSVIFTDSIPAFAVIFKILSPVLPKDFQYFGLWGIMCFVLQGCLTARILRKFMKESCTIVLSSLLVIFSPVMFYRMYGHTALAGQWLLLILLCPLLAYGEYKAGKRIYGEVAIAALLAPAIHMYFALICGITLLGICLRDCLENKTFKRALLLLLEYVAIFLFTTWLLGGFSSEGTSLGGEGLGLYSMNYNALYNPQGWSLFLKDGIQYGIEQQEGFGYLGMGGLLLIAVVAIEILGRRSIVESIRKYWKALVSVLLVIGVICVVASSPIATFNNIKLYELELPGIITKAWSIFRACGRIVMVLPYIFILSFLILGRKISSGKFAAVLVSICLLLQILDISQRLDAIHERFEDKVSYQPSLEEQGLWKEIADNEEIKHVVVGDWLGTDMVRELGEFALDHEKTLNFFVVSHPNIGQLTEDVGEMLQNPTKDEVFIFNYDNCALYDNVNYYENGDYIIGYSGEFEGYEKLENAEKLELPDIDLQCNAENAVVSADTPGQFEVTIHTPQSSSLYFNSDKLNLSYHIYNKKNKRILHDGARTPIRAIRGSDTYTITINEELFGKPGTYYVEFDVVQEGVCWFSDKGMKTCRVKVECS